MVKGIVWLCGRTRYSTSIFRYALMARRKAMANRTTTAAAQFGFGILRTEKRQSFAAISMVARCAESLGPGFLPGRRGRFANWQSRKNCDGAACARWRFMPLA